jgi:hypothetical protein
MTTSFIIHEVGSRTDPGQGLEASGTAQASVMKPVIPIIERTLVRKRLGKLSNADQRSLRAATEQIIG